MRVTVGAPAKVNLWLRVGAPGRDGFHALDTLFCALRLSDTVVVRGRSGADVLTLETAFASPLEALPELGPPERNLAVRAARAFAERAGLDEAPAVRLVKRIPVGAGLGGGSSDAAAVLRALHRLHPGRLDPADLMEIGAGLGSDVPFFVASRALAHGTGRGDALTALPPVPGRPVVVVIPPFPVATGEAYRWLDEDRGAAGTGPSDPLAERLPEGLDWHAIEDRAANDFEEPVYARHPLLAELRDSLRDHGARIALLSGSGSTVFGVFDDRVDARAAAAALRDRDRGLRVVVTATRAR